MNIYYLTAREHNHSWLDLSIPFERALVLTGLGTAVATCARHCVALKGLTTEWPPIAASDSLPAVMALISCVHYGIESIYLHSAPDALPSLVVPHIGRVLMLLHRHN